RSSVSGSGLVSAVALGPGCRSSSTAIANSSSAAASPRLHPLIRMHNLVSASASFNSFSRFSASRTGPSIDCRIRSRRPLACLFIAGHSRLSPLYSSDTGLAQQATHVEVLLDSVGQIVEDGVQSSLRCTPDQRCNDGGVLEEPVHGDSQ